MSRPRSDRRAQLTGFVSAGGVFTMREVAGTLKCGIQQANRLLFRAIESGEIRKAGTQRVDGAKRPVALYKGADVCTDGDTPTLAQAMQGWAR